MKIKCGIESKPEMKKETVSIEISVGTEKNNNIISCYFDYLSVFFSGIFHDSCVYFSD